MNEEQLREAIAAKVAYWHENKASLDQEQQEAFEDELYDLRLKLSEMICGGADDCPSGERPHGSKKGPNKYCLASLNELDTIQPYFKRPNAAEQFIVDYGHLPKAEQIQKMKELSEQKPRELVAYGRTREEAVANWNTLVKGWKP